MKNRRQLQEEFSAAQSRVRAAAARVQAEEASGSVSDVADADEKLKVAVHDQMFARDRLELFEATAEARTIALPDTAPSGAPESEFSHAGSTQARVTKEPLTYRRGGEHSLFRDLYNRDIRHDTGAAERLQRHIVEMEAEGRFDLSSTDEAGGYLVAPLYLQDEFVDRATAGRVIADVIGARPLPPNTDSVNVPKINTGTSVADQADNGAVSETDATFGTLAADVKTKAGMQDVAQQLADRSVPGVDEIIYADLSKEYALQLDRDVINSSTTNSKGILQVTGTNSISYTDASPTLSELYPKIADGIQQIHTGIFMPPTAIFMHPRRWAFCLAAQDGSQRPLVVPDTNAPQNAAGTFDGVISVGRVGTIQGVPVYVDANIPTNLGSGTNEDRIIIVRGDELFLWEDPSGPYLETFRDVGSGNMTVRFRLHNYWAQLHARRPKAISVISGSGLASPSF
jgi:HK97 family phage major capsid protein